MRTLLAALALCIFLGVAVYLAGSFVAASFRIDEWDPFGRLISVWIWGVSTVIGFGALRDLLPGKQP